MGEFFGTWLCVVCTRYCSPVLMGTDWTMLVYWAQSYSCEFLVEFWGWVCRAYSMKLCNSFCVIIFQSHGCKRKWSDMRRAIWNWHSWWVKTQKVSLKLKWRCAFPSSHKTVGSVSSQRYRVSHCFPQEALQYLLPSRLTARDARPFLKVCWCSLHS